MPAPSGPVTLAVSLKMYFDHDRTISWTREVRDVVAASEAVRQGRVRVVILPSFPSIPDVVRAVKGTPIEVGAQTMSSHESGPLTGEVSVLTLKQLGCSHVEIAHAERRRLFGESMHEIRRKVTLASRHQLRVVLCVGEESAPANSVQAARECVAFIEDAFADLPAGDTVQLTVAYEPQWAIGADRPAAPDHIRVVAGEVQSWLEASERVRAPQVIYGGSAGPGLLTTLEDAVSGLFLGRFVHDVTAMAQVLGEAETVSASRVAHDRASSSKPSPRQDAHRPGSPRG